MVRAEAGRGRKRDRKRQPWPSALRLIGKSGVVSPKFVKRGLPAFEAMRRAEQLEARPP
jgi:hypothetical protein